MNFIIAMVEFKGNHSKQYEFFARLYENKEGKIITAMSPKVGDTAVCQTSAGLSIARIVELKDFSKRSSKCNNFILSYSSPEVDAHTLEVFRKEVGERIKEEKEELEAMKEDLKTPEDDFSYLDDLLDDGEENGDFSDLDALF